MTERGFISAAQEKVLLSPLRSGRIAKRSQGGKQLSYLESWDVRAHLIRLFGFGNFDIEVINYSFMDRRDYKNDRDAAMVEVIYSAHVRLTIRDELGGTIACYSEGAVGSASGQMNMLGDLHDNALKTAVSDATKRCAINLGTQFGLSLYDDGNTKDVVKRLIVRRAMETPAADEEPGDTGDSEARNEAVSRTVGGGAAQ